MRATSKTCEAATLVVTGKKKRRMHTSNAKAKPIRMRKATTDD